ncbi:lipase family protein [Ralstonia nicotianae]|uniref:Fungal lipase-like domain-containing protein n=2 Tax=Ralstonia solanacearum species complex TaxID=3116862 RepID=A0ABY6NI83_RALSL|nr:MULTISPECIES: hypothetical protein [Ralstonia]ANH35507.1 hypothetical protein A3768_4702 [Ralstonia solanacearum]AGH87324.1 miscellaneous; unknown [Ralstonia pseudosolanacearum FQY_4]MDO3516097.1 hypothetical protein [Ralstonia pseudosolanacearum]MDO3527606.1 hypothetical protein [Ralstonia pseudosolanacearum]MDO3534355.1 hypothetical protein [Ralstonia pseudosolanacearum]
MMIPLNAPVNREAEVEIDGGRGVICPMCHANRSAYSHPHHQYVRQRAAVAAGAVQEAQMNGDSRPFHAGLATACALIMAGCAAYRQTDSQVVAREPGDRFLGTPKPVQTEAETDWEYAWLSQVAYCKISSVTQAPKGADKNACVHAKEILEHDGWKSWGDLPADELKTAIKGSHLRVEVWEKPSARLLVVAFGGTILKSGKDWKSNLRWFLPGHKDEYTQIVDKFGPAFTDEYLRRVHSAEGAYLKDFRIHSTGHSLGGGLAQQFAYSLPLRPEVPRISHVYAFDPSPVTGFFSVDKETRDQNKKGLNIDRIYERHEILAVVRSFTSLFVPPSKADPSIRGVRYNFFGSINPIYDHSILELAEKLQAVSDHGHAVEAAK